MDPCFEALQGSGVKCVLDAFGIFALFPIFVHHQGGTSCGSFYFCDFDKFCEFPQKKNQMIFLIFLVPTIELDWGLFETHDLVFRGTVGLPYYPPNTF